ncbi:MAG: YggT family protein [Sulfurimonas sp.]|jgi:YggT family protein
MSIYTVGLIIIGIIDIYIWIIIITALLSFVNQENLSHSIKILYGITTRILYKITNPAYVIARKYIKTNFNGLDLAPLFIIIVLQIIVTLLRALLHAL